MISKGSSAIHAFFFQGNMAFGADVFLASPSARAFALWLFNFCVVIDPPRLQKVWDNSDFS